MRIVQGLMFAVISCSSMSSLAFSDNTLIKGVLNEHQLAVEKYAERLQKSVPAVVDYAYGMQLDIAKVVRRSPEGHSRNVVAQLLTYEDSSGKLHTIRYQTISNRQGEK
ncbi:DUF2790 domain-containing protein [Pseudomonas sp. nanlin1]|uniref:DUF2790 domain-containing protein n=1 Tax=Pseudomonas sp. nanlin1 TaxID=3040605 RepID=UPI00388E4042